MAGVLFDLDGVFYAADEPVPGAVDTLEWFRQRGIPYLIEVGLDISVNSVRVEEHL